jgi:hypothetical protein
MGDFFIWLIVRDASLVMFRILILLSVVCPLFKAHAIFVLFRVIGIARFYYDTTFFRSGFDEIRDNCSSLICALVCTPVCTLVCTPVCTLVWIYVEFVHLCNDCIERQGHTFDNWFF